MAHEPDTRKYALCYLLNQEPTDVSTAGRMSNVYEANDHLLGFNGMIAPGEPVQVFPQIHGYYDTYEEAEHIRQQKLMPDKYFVVPMRNYTGQGY